MNYLKKPFEDFFKLETSGSILLFLATISALFLANSPWSADFLAIWDTNFKIGFGNSPIKLEKPLILWINDGLMAIFFFVIGLEIKREILLGELNSMKKATLPIFAALGGMIVPVILFIILIGKGHGFEGWGIPMATDIAFSLGILKILGNRVPLGLKIFLTAFAIVDDLGAVLVIALFYSNQIAWSLIISALVLLAILFVLSSRHYYNKYIYFILGFIIWVLFLKSGIHPTIAGILVAFTIPVRRKIKTYKYYKEASESLAVMRGNEDNQPNMLTHEQIAALNTLENLTEQTQSPLQHLEHKLHGWVTFVIMPIFALANAGVVLGADTLHNMEFSGIIATSMILGKAIGITLFSWIAIKFGLAQLPENVNMKQITGVGFLGGLGFTMALFIAGLAFTDPVLIAGSKTGILMGSIIAGLIGFLILKAALKNVTPEPEE